MWMQTAGGIGWDTAFPPIQRAQQAIGRCICQRVQGSTTI